MPRTKLLVSALALALAGASAAQAQSFTDVVTFGDSLSDAGNVGQLLGRPGNTFTTNPDPVYAELVAQAFGYPGTYSRAGGSDYAYAGACARSNSATFTCFSDPSGAGAFSVTNVLGGYLAAHGGQADPNALYMIWAGGNDVRMASLNPATASQNTGIAAATTVGLIGRLQNAGAQTIVVFNLPDLGLIPGTVGTANQPNASALSFVFNSTFNGGLATLKDGIVPINVFGLVNEFVANPSLYGFTNVTQAACGPLVGTNSVACGPAGSGMPYTYAAGSNQTYLFADGLHPTGGTHAMLANVVIATLSAPGQVSMAGEIPLQVYDNVSATINQQIFTMNRAQRSAEESNVYGHVQFSRQEFNAAANTNAMDHGLFSATVGADVRYNDVISLGAALSFGGSSADGHGLDIDGKEVMASAYGVLHFGSGYINAIASGGSNHLDIDRSIVLGTATRVERGNTSATHTAFEIGGGFAFGSDSFRHGPFASLTWQKVEVKGYAEDGTDSTSMYFNDFDRDSSVVRLGYQAQGTSGSFRPFGRIAMARESQNDVTRVQAGSNTMNGHFTLDGFQAGEDWLEADLGVRYAFNDTSSASFAYRGRLNDDTQDMNSINLGFRKEFGAAQAPAPEPVVVAQTTCADLDDDGDGVNNCNDKCPGSASGEAVGPDGCPVPAAEPEPVMEAKAFRN